MSFYLKKESLLFVAWLWEYPEKPGGEALKELLKEKRTIPTPGVFNPLVARLAKKLGFSCLYFSGAAFSASRAYPDLGYFTLSELRDAVLEIYRASLLPIIVDVDTGFGEVLHILRLVREMEDIGVAAIQIEDQELPKKCGHLEGKKLIPKEDMARKIAAVKKVAKNLLVVARTDARGVEGIEEAIKRAKLYQEAGADIIFPEALKSKEEFQRFREEISIPLLANMTEFGKTPYMSVQEFQEIGYEIVIFPVTTLRVAMKAIEGVLQEILLKGTQKDWIEKMQTRKELYELIDYQDYEKIDQEIARINFSS